MDLLAGKSLMVDRVASLEEALLFWRAGASIVGAALEAEVRLPDERFVTDGVAQAIRDAIGAERFVGIMPWSHEQDGFYDGLQRVLDLEPGWLQVHAKDADADLGEYIREFEEGLPIIVDGLWMNEDYGALTPPDDPARFFMGDYASIAPVRPDLAMVDLKGEDPDVWQHLTTFIQQVQEEFRGEFLQAGHIQAATLKAPLLLDLAGVQPRDARAFVQAFPDAKGFYARLGPEQGGCTSIRPERLLPVLEALRG